MSRTIRYIRKAVIGTVGTLVLIIGIILIPLPGPGFLVVFAGIFILSLEFAWFEQHVERSKKLAKKVVQPQKRQEPQTKKKKR